MSTEQIIRASAFGMNRSLQPEATHCECLRRPHHSPLLQRLRLIPLEKVPSAVGQVSSVDIERTGSPAIEQAIQQYVPGAIVSDVNGNAFSTDVQFRGFTASPVEGTPQGLAVYQNGVRINEVFGDTVRCEKEMFMSAIYFEIQA